MITKILNSLAIVLSLSTATGVLVHDTKIDKAAATALASPLLVTSFEASVKTTNVQPELHTHVERTSFAQALHTQNPSLKPRSDEDKKHLLPNNVARGHHPFDNYNLPIA